jgi:hypothetical protein
MSRTRIYTRDANGRTYGVMPWHRWLRAMQRGFGL